MTVADSQHPRADDRPRLWSVRVTFTALIEANTDTAAEDAAVELIGDYLNGSHIGLGVRYETELAEGRTDG